jgi:hypothetical protein
MFLGPQPEWPECLRLQNAQAPHLLAVCQLECSTAQLPMHNCFYLTMVHMMVCVETDKMCVLVMVFAELSGCSVPTLNLDRAGSGICSHKDVFTDPKYRTRIYALILKGNFLIDGQ